MPKLGRTYATYAKYANSIFGKVGRIASEKVIIQLILSKCIPIPMSNGLEACPLKKSDSKSLDFVVDFS